MINGPGLPGYGGFALFENEWMTETETERFPERSWWRRLYRTHRIDTITWPMRDLYLLPPDRVYGHPVVIRRLREVLELGADQRVLQEVKDAHYPPLHIERSYVYNWRVVCWAIILAALCLLVVWCSIQRG